MAIDLTAMDALLEVDAVSRAARIQAGASGPRLEAQLAEHGLTLRFFPQSFELSTLGGWIATRAAGHYATGPTHIDDLVESVRALTAGGDVWESRRLPASGAGPSPDRMLLGSEGTLAVITEAWVRVRERPRERRSASVAFPNFAAGAEAVRAIVQAGMQPANLRLVDPREAALTFAGDSLVAASQRCSSSASRTSSSRSTPPRRCAARTAARCASPAAARVHGARRSCARPTSATCSSPWAC